ncbi:MAG: hypothetical protein Q9200_007782, partial [Gallowayella weberi]
MLPYALSDRVGIAQEDVQRWNSILLGSFGGALMLGSLVVGWIGDQLPTRQTPFLLGLVALGLSTLAIALTRNISMLLVARILQGLSSAVVSTVGYAILFDVVGSEKIGRALGFVSMCQSFGLLVGPATGGILYEQGGYFSTFIPAFLLIIIEIALRFLMVVKKRDRSQKEEEVQVPPEASTLAKGYTANPLYGTTLPPDTGQVPEDAGLKNNNRKSFIETCSDRPQISQATSTIPPSASSSTIKTIRLLLTSPRILTALLALFILNTILTAYDATLPVHIRSTFSLPSSRASFLFLIMVSPFSLAPLAGLIIDHRGPYIPCTLGLLILVPPVFILQILNSPTCCSNTIPPFQALALCLFAIGLGTAFVQPGL